MTDGLSPPSSDNSSVFPFVFFDPPLDFFLFFAYADEFFAALAETDASPPLLLFDGALGPGVDVGVAACEGVVWAEEGPGESYLTFILE